MNESTLLDHSLHYETTIRDQLKHPRPEARPNRKPMKAMRIRLAHVLRAFARILEPEPTQRADPITE